MSKTSAPGATPKAAWLGAFNDFDEAWWLPYTNDLVRLAASAAIAAAENHLGIGINRSEGDPSGAERPDELSGTPLFFGSHDTVWRLLSGPAREAKFRQCIRV